MLIQIMNFQQYIVLNLIYNFQITELKAKHFTIENELRNKMKNTQKDHETKTEMLNSRIQSLLKEVATLSKSTKKDRLAAAREAANSGSGTDSPSIS